MPDDERSAADPDAAELTDEQTDLIAGATEPDPAGGSAGGQAAGVEASDTAGASDSSGPSQPADVAPDPTGSDEAADSTEPEAGKDPAAERAGIHAVPADDELAEINEERRRRLDPDNRPKNSEIDNSEATLPTVEAWHEEQKSEESAGGTSDPSATFRDIEPSEEEREAMAEERERRLDPANRPDNVEVDNSERTFEDGHFVD